MNVDIRNRYNMYNKAQLIEGFNRADDKLIANKWELVKIQDIANCVIAGATPSTRQERFWNGDIPWMSSGEINLRYVYSTEKKITREGYESSSTRFIPENSVLIALAGQGQTRGRVAINRIRLCTNQSLCAIVPNGKVDYRYLFYNIESRYDELRKLSTGDGGRGGLNLQIIKNLDIHLPPLQEQQKIAKILSVWDDAIDLKEKLYEEKKLHKKVLMNKLLSGEVRIQGFNDEWKNIRLGDIFERVTRKNSEINTNVLTISAQRGLINQKDYFNKSVASAILDNYFLINKGEFAYNKSYSNGYPMGAIKRLKLYESGVVTTLYICFRLFNESLDDATFYEHYFESGMLIEQLKQIAYEGGRAHGLLNVSPKDFFELKLPRPMIEEQKSLSRIFTTAHMQVELLERELEALKLQKKGLMQLLLTGIIRVQC